MICYASSYSTGFLPSPIRQTQEISPLYRSIRLSRSGRSGFPTSSCKYCEWHPWQRKAQLEIEIVKLISNGTSAMVTACSTYLSGGSVVLNVPSTT